jgi:hypothetical protein
MHIKRKISWSLQPQRNTQNHDLHYPQKMAWLNRKLALGTQLFWVTMWDKSHFLSLSLFFCLSAVEHLETAHIYRYLIWLLRYIAVIAYCATPKHGFIWICQFLQVSAHWCSSMLTTTSTSANIGYLQRSYSVTTRWTKEVLEGSCWDLVGMACHTFERALGIVCRALPVTTLHESLTQTSIFRIYCLSNSKWILTKRNSTKKIFCSLRRLQVWVLQLASYVSC